MPGAVLLAVGALLLVLPAALGAWRPVYFAPRQGILVVPWVAVTLAGPLASLLRRPGLIVLACLLWAQAVSGLLYADLSQYGFTEEHLVQDMQHTAQDNDVLVVPTKGLHLFEYYLRRNNLHVRLVDSPPAGIPEASHVFWVAARDNSSPSLPGWGFQHISYTGLQDMPMRRPCFDHMDVYTRPAWRQGL